MGRGRAKAKQTKVARELKYSTHTTDLEQLQRELAAGGGPPYESTPKPAADELDDEDVDDLDEPWAASR